MQASEQPQAPAPNRRGLAAGSVRVGPLMSIPAVLRQLGCKPGPVFASAGLQTAQFEDADNEIPYTAAGRLLAGCVAATGCQHFGLLVSKCADPSSLGIAGFMLRSAPDVGSALRALTQHLDLHDEGGVPTLLIKGGVTLLGYAIHQPGTESSDQIYDLSIAIGCNIMRSLCGESWNPSEVLLSRRPPSELEPYRTIFRAPLRFNASQSALVFPSHWLDHQIPSADPLLHRHFEKEAREQHNHRDASIAAGVRGLLRKSLLAHTCTLADVARQLCIHERTLNRKLHSEDTSFRQELDAVRQEMARQLLVDSAMPIARVAMALNYADVSAFSRAFKRWTGFTPAQWRTRNVASQ